MTRRQKDPLRKLSKEEKEELERISRAKSEPAEAVIRAKMLLAAAEGKNYTDAARSVGRRSGDAVSTLVSRFNKEGIEALTPRYGNNPKVTYGVAEKKRILQEFQRQPDREKDGTASWSLSTLQRALRNAPDGLPNISTYTILQTLWENGWTWQADRTWCKTGKVLRKRKEGVVEVTDPDAEVKKS